MSEFLGAGRSESAVVFAEDPTSGSADAVGVGGPSLPDETTLAMWRDWSSTA